MRRAPVDGYRRRLTNNGTIASAAKVTLAGSGTTIAKPPIPKPATVGAKLPISVYAPLLRLNEYSEFDGTRLLGMGPDVEKYPESPIAAIPPTPPIGGETAAITELAAVDGLMANRESVTRSSPTSMLSLRQARPLISWITAADDAHRRRGGRVVE